MSSIKKVDRLILGAGPSGLAHAVRAKKDGVDFLLLEGSDRVGGNCYTFWEGGFGFDSGAHRVHDKNEKVTQYIKSLLGDDLRKVDRPSSIYKGDSFYTFPIKPIEVLKKISLDKWFRVFADRFRPKQMGYSFESDAINRYGKYLANEFLLNYSQKLWGVPCSELVPEVSGKRLGGISIGKLFKETLLGKEAEHIDGSFYYPKRGIHQIFQKMQNDIQDKLILNSKVSSLEINDDGNFVVKVNDQVFHSKELYTSLPVQSLSKVLSVELNLQYRHLALVMFEYHSERLTDKATLYFPEEKYCFTRLTEPKNRSEDLCPEGKSSLVFEIPYFDEDKLSKMSDQFIVDMVIGQLPDIIDRNLIKGGVVKRLKNSYPVMTHQSKAQIQILQKSIQEIPNLHLIGRVGKFEYLHIHDLLEVVVC